MRLMTVLFILLMTINTAQAQKIKVNYEGITLNNNKLTIKTNINGHKVRLRTPSISKNKYLKLVNVVM